MRPLNILAADDYFYGIDLARALVKILQESHVDINFYYSNYIKKEYLQKAIKSGRAKYGTKSYEEHINDLEYIDICFLDIVWYSEVEIDLKCKDSDKGAKIVVKMLKDKHPECLIILLTHQVGRSAEFQKHTIDGEEFFFISKMISEDSENKKSFDNLSNKQVEFLYRILEERQNENIKYSSNISHLEEVRSTFQQKQNKSGSFQIDNRLYLHNISLEGRIFFQYKSIMQVLDSSIKFTHPKKIGYWAKNKDLDLVVIYKRYLELDQKSNKRISMNINKNAIEILKNRLNNIKGNEPFKIFSEITISNIILMQYAKSIPDTFYSLLTWRKVIIGFCTVAEKIKEHNWKKDWQIGQLYFEQLQGNQESTLKRIFSLLGFKRSDGVINHSSLLTENCFPEENEWRENVLSFLELDK